MHTVCLVMRFQAPHFPNRRDGGGDPNFPALYDWCRGSRGQLVPMLKRAGFDDVHIQRFWGHGYFDRMPGLKHTSTRIGGVVRYRTWGVALPIAQVLRWAQEDGVRVQKRSMLNQVHSAACQMGMEQAFLDKVPLEIRRRLPGPVSAAPSPMQQPVRVSRPNPQGIPMAA